jgi:hypothetical protein
VTVVENSVPKRHDGEHFGQETSKAENAWVMKVHMGLMLKCNFIERSARLWML